MPDTQLSESRGSPAQVSRRDSPLREGLGFA